MPITGALILTALGVVIMLAGLVVGNGPLPLPVWMIGLLITAISLFSAKRDVFMYRAQRRHIDSKRNAKLNTSARPPQSAEADSRLEAFLDSQPPTRKD